MTERERLIELLEVSGKKVGKYIDNSGVVPTAKEIYGVRADYLLANGVIVPPCKVGDKVWYITNGKIDNAEVVCIDCRNSGNHIIAHKYIEETEEIKKLCVYFSDVNKIVYLTKEEALQALKEGGKE